MADDWRPWRISSPELLSRYVNHVAAARAVKDDFFAGVSVDGRETSIHDLRSQNRLGQIVRTIYDGLIPLGIKYDVEPINLASPETVDQEIRTPAEVVHTRIGTCLDLALFFAGLCVKARLLPLIVLLRHAASQSAHALVVVDGKYTHDDWEKPRGWKQADRDNAIIGRDAGQKYWADGGELWRRILDGLYIPVECTGFAATRADGRMSDTLSFTEAEQRARQNLQDFGHVATLDVIRFQMRKGYPAYRPLAMHWPAFSKLGLWRQTQREQLTRLQHPFVGRDAARKTVEDFLAKSDGPSCLCITAPAGYGKSALMAKLVLSHPGSVYRFVGEGESGADLLGSVCTQLSALSGEHASYYGRPAIELNDVFDRLVADVISRRNRDGALPIFIDGLDEGLLEGTNRLGVAEFLSDPPAGTRLVLSCKSGLEALVSGTSQPLKLDEFGDCDVRDLFNLFGRPDLANDADLIQELMSRTAGEPFYLRFLTEDLALAEQPASLIDRLPARAEEYLKAQLRRLDELWSIEGVGVTLAILVQAKGWLRQASLLRMLENKVGTDATRRILRALRPRYLTTQPPSDPGKRSDEAYRIWPVRLRNAVYELFAGSPELEQGKAILIDFCRNWASHRDSYALEHACGHFFEQGDLAALTAVLASPFLRARAEHEGGFHGPLADTENAVRLALERRDTAKIVRAAGTHAWLQRVVGYRAAHGGIALDAHRGLIRSALSGARALRGQPKHIQLLIIAEALLHHQRHAEAADVVEEAVQIEAQIEQFDDRAVNTLARNLLRETGRADLARKLWTSHGSYDTADKMMAEVAGGLVGSNIDRAFEIAAKIADRETRRDAFAAIRNEAASRNMALPDPALAQDDAAEPTEATADVVVIEELAKTDPMEAKHFIEQGMDQCRQRLRVDPKDYDAIAIMNQLIMQLATVDPMRAIDAAINEAGDYSAYFHRGAVLAEVGATVAAHHVPAEALRRLLRAARAHAAAGRLHGQPTAVDRLSVALVSCLSDLEEAYALLAQMDDPNLAAETAIAGLARGGDGMVRAAAIVERATRVTDGMGARLREIESERAERFLTVLSAGPVRWWLRLAIAKRDPAAVAELREAARALPPFAELAATMELARRFSDTASLRRAVELQRSPATWQGQHDFKRTDKLLELARLASEMDPAVALGLYRETALDIPERWHEGARHRYALGVFDALAETGFEADRETLQKLFALLQTDYSRSRTIMRVKGIDAVIADITDRVEASVVPLVNQLLGKAADANDASQLARLDQIYPGHKILAIKIERAKAAPPGSQERRGVVADIVELCSQPIPEQEYPLERIYQVGQILAQERPDALEGAAAHLSLTERPYFCIGAASAVQPSSVGRSGRLANFLRPPPSTPWLRRAERAAAAIETAEADHVGNHSPDDKPPEDWKDYAAMNSAGTYANMVLFAAKITTGQRRVWAVRAFETLRRIKDVYHRLPSTLDIAITLANREPELCRREATHAIKMLPQLLGERMGIKELREVLEAERNAAPQIAIRRQSWEGILGLASLKHASRWSKRPLIEDEPELLALAGFWSSRLGGDVPEAFWKQIEQAVETRFASLRNDMDDYKQKILDRVQAFSIAARALSHRSQAVSEFHHLADSQAVLVTTLRYFPFLPEDTDRWNALVARIRDLDALEAAARRVGNLPGSIALVPLLKGYPPSPHRSKILDILLDGIDDPALLVPLADLALDYPRDLISWAASFIRIGHNCDWHAITDEIMELRKLSTSTSAAGMDGGGLHARR